MNKAKELLNKLKEFVSLHKVVCLSAAGVVCAVAVTGIVVAVVLLEITQRLIQWLVWKRHRKKLCRL